MTYSACGVRGHNKRHHFSTPAISDDIVGTPLVDVESQPTNISTAANHTSTSSAASDLGQQAYNVDNMVNSFEEIQAVESSQLRAARAYGRRHAKMATSTS
ncbi:Hypothetical predicted protein [Olea europaea subsp. europaea]|uniref:Uncharacterized protein n=1 Tax=Olea europaea subsp. europaea TaxID=158383 RepID=A0A8S0PE13_OLEEU|nr:Hypothetical predicted protein [Olea europaea subsp. europaea]